MGKVRKWLRWASLGMLVVVLGVLGWGYWGWSSVPEYWVVVDVTRPEVARDAERFELWASSQVTRDRMGQTEWKIEVDEGQVNEWLAARLAVWAANQGIALPEWLHEPMVVIGDGELIVAARVEQDGFDKVVSLVYEPEIGQDVAMMNLTGLRIASLDLPADLVMERAMAEYTAEERAEIDEAIRRVRLRTELGDGRVVEVMDVELREGTAVLSCRTVRE